MTQFGNHFELQVLLRGLRQEIVDIKQQLNTYKIAMQTAINDFKTMEGCTIKSSFCAACHACKKSIINNGDCYHIVCKGFKWNGLDMPC